MRIPLMERNKRITEIAPVVRVFAVLFLTTGILVYIPFSTDMPGVIFNIIIVLMLLYIFTLGIEKIRNWLARGGLEFLPFYLDYITLAVSIIFLATIIFVTGGALSNLKVLFLPMILFYTVRFGVQWGLASAVISAGILAGFNLYRHFFLEAYAPLELDLIYAGVFILTAWLVGSIVDTERSISDRLSRQVLIDDLTGLYNHRSFQDYLKELTETDKLPFGLIMADLDFFKRYNETYGHQDGDQLLIAVAEGISKVVGDEGISFRYGSDEFAVIAKEADRDKTLRLAEKIRNNIKNNEVAHKTDIFWKYDLTASLGVAMFPEDASTREELLKKVDEALYKAKVISGNKVEAYFSVLDQIKTKADSTELDILEQLKTFLAIINARDRYTFGHSERVLIYASIIANLMDLPAEEKKYLQYGVYLHDIGKIEIDRYILNKPGPLSESEWDIMKKHPIWGAEMVKQIKLLEPVLPVILYHHERFDGKGYPYGLAKKTIPLAAQITALADAFDSMTVERPFKRAKTVKEALLELERNCYTQFDPNLVDVFTRFIKDKTIDETLARGLKEHSLYQWT